MPATLLTLFQSLAEKAGIPSDDAALTQFFQHEAMKATVPDEVVNAVNKNLISLEDAKNNHPAIKSHYFAEVMANVDRALGKVYQKLELDEDLITELSRETSSTKRIALLGDKLSETMKEKIEAAGKGNNTDKTALQTQIDTLNNQLRVEKEARAAEKASADKALSDFRVKTVLSGKMSGLKTVYDTLPSDARAIAIETLINKELQDSEVEWKLDDNGNVKPVKKDGSNYYDENNRLINADDFIQRTLAKNKVLSQNPAPTNGQPSRNGQQSSGEQPGQGAQPNAVNAGGQKNATGKMTSSLIEESLGALNNSNPMDIATGATGGQK